MVVVDQSTLGPFRQYSKPRRRLANHSRQGTISGDSLAIVGRDSPFSPVSKPATNYDNGIERAMTSTLEKPKSALVATATMIGLFFSYCLGVAQAEVQVKQMHVITRHGSRYPLQKEANTLQDISYGSLTPFGQKQMYDLGKWVKDTYNSTGFFARYSPWTVRLESSALDRTLVSADAFALGAYDYQARDPFEESLLPNMPPNIPVYSTPQDDDIELRAFDKCETFHRRLDELYASQAWRDLEQAHLPLLTRLALLDSFASDADEQGKIPLVNLWNVYDSIHVAKTECTFSSEGFTATCNSLENPADAHALTETEFLELEQLTSRVEQLRYGPARAGILLGGPLMLRILDRMTRHLSGQFYLYSAHYATILGVLSALGETFPAQSSIPDYASALLLMLVEDTTTGLQRVQIIFKEDSSLMTAPAIVPLSFCADELSCPLPAMQKRFLDFSFKKWCEECDNRQAAVCLDFWMEESESRNFGLEKPLRDGFLLGFGASVFFAVLSCIICSRTRTKWVGQNSPPAIPPESSTTTPLETKIDEPESAGEPPKGPVLV